MKKADLTNWQLFVYLLKSLLPKRKQPIDKVEYYETDQEQHLVFRTNEDTGDNRIEIPISRDWLQEFGWQPGQTLEMRLTSKGIIVRPSQISEAVTEEFRQRYESWLAHQEDLRKRDPEDSDDWADVVYINDGNINQNARETDYEQN